MNHNVIDNFMSPGSVAIVGASTNPDSISGKAVYYLNKFGYRGDIFPINPRHSNIQGLKAMASIDALPAAPDLGIISVRANQAVPSVIGLADHGCKNIMIYSSGFAETGAQGALLQQQLKDIAVERSLRILGPNCIGVANRKTGFYASFLGNLELDSSTDGGIGIVSQSGAYADYLLGLAKTRNIPIPFIATTGNEVDLTFVDFARWMIQQDAVRVVSIYAESIRNGQDFIDLLREARDRQKLIVLQKVGSSELGKKAAESHTAALASDDAVLDSILDEFGVVRVSGAVEMFDVSLAAERNGLVRNRNLAVLTISGGGGIMACDAADQFNLQMPPLSQRSQAVLRELIPFCAPRNPVDCTAQIVSNLRMLDAFVDEILQANDYGAILLFFTIMRSDIYKDELFDILAAARERYPDVLFVIVMCEPYDYRLRYQRLGFVVVEDIVIGVKIISRLSSVREAWSSATMSIGEFSQDLVRIGQTQYNEVEAKDYLKKNGLNVTHDIVCNSKAELPAAAEKIGLPVTLKIVSREIVHKTDIGGVIVNCKSMSDVIAAGERLFELSEKEELRGKIDGVVVSEHVASGLEIFMGIVRDPVFGVMAVIGSGGIFVEVLNDTVFRRCPFDQEEALRLIGQMKLGAILNGARGAKYDLHAAASMFSKLSQIGALNEGVIDAIDLNPVIVNEDGCVIVDAAINAA